ncbi:MAG: TonB-dependent receptor [Alphaproteobacteria bacterium]|nr:TonB-dependent receptor [Alphaproteobacteria bacterium]
MTLKSTLLGSVLALTPLAAIAQNATPTQEESSAVTTVIVTGVRDPEDPPIVAEARQNLSRTPGAVSVVSNESIETRSAQGLYDLLRDVPGVLTAKRYGEEARVSIRGSGIGQAFHQRGVLFAQDGVPFADADGFGDFQKIDPLTARYIEVYRGGNALRFGGAQLGGVLNLVTPTGRTAESTGLLRVEGGSYGLFRTAGQYADVFGNWDVFAAINRLEADGYRDQTQQEQLRGTINLGYQFGADREVRLIAYGADIEQDVPGGVTLSNALAHPRAALATAKTFNFQRDQSVARVSLQTRWRLDDSAVFEGGLYATGTDLVHPISLGILQQIETQGAFGRLDWEGEVSGLRADVFAGLSYRQGIVDQRLYQTTFPITGSTLQDATGLDLFAEGRLFVTDQIALVAGGSYGLATRDFIDRLNGANNADADFDWFAPRLGVLWENEAGTQVYANVTRSVEPPHYGALVQSGVLVPVVPQEAWTGEIGTRGRVGDLIWDLTLYRSEIEGELLSFLTGAAPASVFNAGNTVHQGVEAALDWVVTRDFLNGVWLLRQTYTYSDFFFDGDPVYGDSRLPVVPEHQYRAMLRYSHPDGWFVAPNVEWRPKDVFVDYANTMKAPGFTLLSLNAGYEFENGLTLFLDGRNLTDERYVAEFGAVTDATAGGVSTAVFFPGEGLTVTAGLSFRF